MPWIFQQALAVAKENAAALGAEIRFFQGDTLEPVADQQWDLIVSNPPYISAEEWPLMDISVREKEPKMALLHKNKDWRSISNWHSKHRIVWRLTGKWR